MPFPIGATLKTLPRRGLVISTSGEEKQPLHDAMIAPMATPALSGMVAAVSARSPRLRLARPMRPLACAAHIFVPSANTISSKETTTHCAGWQRNQKKCVWADWCAAAYANWRHGGYACGRRGSTTAVADVRQCVNFSAGLAWACCAARLDLPLRRGPPPERRRRPLRRRLGWHPQGPHQGPHPRVGREQLPRQEGRHRLRRVLRGVHEEARCPGQVSAKPFGWICQ